MQYRIQDLLTAIDSIPLIAWPLIAGLILLPDHAWRNRKANR